MWRIYQVYYFPADWRPYLRTRRQPYMDVRHIVRARLADQPDTVPVDVAEAEGALAGIRRGRSAIYHSIKMTDEVLASCEPALVARIARIVEDTRAEVEV